MPLASSTVAGGGFALAAALGDRREIRAVFDLFGRVMKGPFVALGVLKGPFVASTCRSDARFCRCSLIAFTRQVLTEGERP
jgi:hypothetical protein